MRLTFHKDPPSAVPQTAKPVDFKSPATDKAPQAGSATDSSAEAPAAGIAAPLQRSGHRYTEASATGHAKQFNGNACDDHVGSSHTYTKPMASDVSDQFNGNATPGVFKHFMTREDIGKLESKVGGSGK